MIPKDIQSDTAWRGVMLTTHNVDQAISALRRARGSSGQSARQTYIFDAKSR